MRIVVAGGAGFIGSHLTRRFLGQGHEVVILDNFVTGRWANTRILQDGPWADRVRLVHANICRLPDIDGHVDAVLNLASPASPVDYLRQPIETLETGSLGTRNLLDLAREHGARFLLASTSEVYGDPLVHPQPETYWGNVNPIGPRSVYDEAKRFAEALASAFARKEGLTVRIARIFNTYGPGMRLDDGRVIPTFVGQALRGWPITVHGDGLQTRSYCYVDDLVEGLDRLLWSDVEGPVNIGNDEELTILETAQKVVALTGAGSVIIHRPMPVDDPRKRRPDLTRAVRHLGWRPRVPFEAGLQLTVADLSERIMNGEMDEVIHPSERVRRPALRSRRRPRQQEERPGTSVGA
jgi:dTDP-glucose 4,6-dehydratase